MPKTKSGRRQPAAGAPTTRASQRAHVRASTAATKASSSTQKWAKRTTETTVTETSHEPSLPTTSTAQQEALLSPQFMETLVSRVADEVSRRLSPAETPAVIPLVVPSALNEVPVCPLANSESVGNNAVASAIVQGTLAQVSAAVTGLSPSVPSQASPLVPGQLFQSVSLPVDARVSAKLRAKIWNDEYIDFGSLITNPVFGNQYQITLQNAESGPVPSLCIEPISKPKKIVSIENWLSSFHVFVGVYTKQFPHEAPSLMKYGEIIQDLAGRGHNWKYYDENFRFVRQTHRTALPWDRIHGELWLKSQAGLCRTPQQNTTVPPQMRADLVPKGYCFRFHKGHRCLPGCAFKHLCLKCQGSHPVTKCNFRVSARPSSFQPQPAKSLPTQPITHPSKR